MADKSLYQLPSASDVGLTDLVYLEQVDEHAEEGFVTKNVQAAILGETIVSEFQYSSSGLVTEDKTIIGAINEIAEGGGGAGAFYITMTQSGSSYSVDKTKDEIDGAYANGQALVVIFNVTPKKYFYLAEFKDNTSYKDYYFSYQMRQGAWDFCLTTHSGGVVIQNFNITTLARIDNTATETSSAWSSSKTHAEDLATLSSAESYTDEAIVDILPTETASGSVANFETSLALPLVECKAQIVPIQEGTGDPSPSNVRPISGWTACTISHSGADMSNPTEYEIDLDGTVYVGELDVKRGVLKINGELITLNGSEAWYATSVSTVFYTPFTYAPIVCDTYSVKSAGYPANMTNYTMEQSVDFQRLQIRDDRFSSASDFAANLANDNVRLVKRLATPIEVSLTPEEITTLAGVNNVWADTGDIEVEFKMSIKDYIDSKLASLSSGTRSVKSIEEPKTEEKTEEKETEGGENER
jgi:hypothetical protein